MLRSAPQRGLRITDCARITDCRRRRRSTGSPDYGFFGEPVRLVSGQVQPHEKCRSGRAPIGRLAEGE
eukprot:15440662-Alexandrium_andersonii.AAC.1